MNTIADVQKLALELLNTEFTFVTYKGTHKVRPTDLGYRFEFDNAKRSFGRCFYVKKKITLSLPLCLHNLDKLNAKIKDTILHEIAHALSVHIFGREGKGHGYNWQSIARQIGSDGKRCFDSSKVNTPKGKYALVCDNCGKETQKHRKVTRSYACGACCKEHNGGRFTNKYLLRLIEN